ncbi:MAG TPA: ABC transporter substrate-binding protein [Stellaceae bacterium]|nr:ABC transporter substrate-binding protein [Stellaceae bacterium]
MQYRIFLTALTLVFSAHFATAESIKIGGAKTASGGPAFIAIDKGYFAAEGLDATMVFFDSAQPTAVAVVSGDIDIGTTGLSAGLYNLAGQGALRIIGATGHESPGFHTIAYFVSKRAYDSSLKSLRDLAGRTFGLGQFGTPGHYVLGATAEKYGIDLSRIHLVALQSNANVISAMMGGQVDGTVTVLATGYVPLIEKGDIKVLSWVGDEMPFQDRAIFTATKTANERGDMLQRFLRAYRKGAKDFHDAFTGPDERPKDGPTAAATIALIAKWVEQSPEQVRGGIAYIDPELRVNVADVLRQIAWYKAQGMLKPEVDGNQIIDKRYVVPLP